MTVSLLSSPSIVVRNDTASSNSSISSCLVLSVAAAAAAAGQLAFQPLPKRRNSSQLGTCMCPFPYIYVLGSNKAREVYTESEGIDVQSS